MNSERIPFSKAILSILLFTLIVSGSGTLGWLYYRHINELRLRDNTYLISAVVQTAKGETLPRGCLIKLLGLSKQQPMNLYRYNLEEGEKKLKADPLLCKGEIKKVFPNMLWVDYQMRQPIALIEDYTNTAIDAEGVLFPLRPFFKKTNFPTIYLGLNIKGKVWGTKIHDSRFKLAREVIKHVKLYESKNLKLRKIDVADATAESCGKRQIIMLCEDGNGVERYLRLSVEDYRQGLADYMILADKVLHDTPREALAVDVIDLRAPQLAFLKLEE